MYFIAGVIWIKVKLFECLKHLGSVVTLNRNKWCHDDHQGHNYHQNDHDNQNETVAEKRKDWPKLQLGTSLSARSTPRRLLATTDLMYAFKSSPASWLWSSWWQGYLSNIKHCVIYFPKYENLPKTALPSSSFSFHRITIIYHALYFNLG